MNIGFIGLGIMGESMCENLVKKSNQNVYVFDLDTQKIEKLVSLGAIATSSIEDIGTKADYIFSMVPKSEHVISVYEKLLELAKPNQIFIDMSTIEPSVSVKLSNEISLKGSKMLDAPVVKSKPAAINGTLGIYVGGDYDTFKKVEKLLLMMGNNVIHMGSNGTGLIMKICHNMLVGQIQNGVNEMLTLATKSGIDIDSFTTAISYGGGQNFYLDAKSNAIKENDFTTAFSVENMHKDVNIAYSMVKDMNLNLNGVLIVKDIYEKAMELGYGKEDFSATYKVVSNS